MDVDLADPELNKAATKIQCRALSFAGGSVLGGRVWNFHSEELCSPSGRIHAYVPSVVVDYIASKNAQKYLL